MNSALTAPLALAAAVTGWGLSPIFIRYLSDAYDPFTLTFLRYAVATIILMGVVWRFYPTVLEETRREWRGLAQLAAINIVMQTLWTLACYQSTATTAQLITKSETLFVVLLSYALFHEERRVIRHPLFLAGGALSMLGVLGIMVPNPSARLIPQADFAFLLLVLVSIAWSVYAVRGKQIARRMHPIPMFTVVALFSTLGYAILALLLGDPASIAQTSPKTALLTIVSGLLPIAIAHCAYHIAQLSLGAAFCITMMLCNPLFTHLIALALWDDEAMSWTQWTGAAMLVSGSVGVIQAQRRAGRLPVKQEPVPPE